MMGIPKTIKELKIQEVREQLEKRGLDKTGVKAVLLSRLEEALIDEGKDPETHRFELEEERGVENETTNEEGMDGGATGEQMEEKIELEDRDVKMMKFMETLINESKDSMERVGKKSRE